MYLAAASAFTPAKVDRTVAAAAAAAAPAPGYFVFETETTYFFLAMLFGFVRFTVI